MEKYINVVVLKSNDDCRMCKLQKGARKKTKPSKRQKLLQWGMSNAVRVQKRDKGQNNNPKSERGCQSKRDAEILEKSHNKNREKRLQINLCSSKRLDEVSSLDMEKCWQRNSKRYALTSYQWKSFGQPIRKLTTFRLENPCQVTLCTKNNRQVRQIYLDYLTEVYE